MLVSRKGKIGGKGKLISRSSEKKKEDNKEQFFEFIFYDPPNEDVKKFGKKEDEYKLSDVNEEFQDILEGVKVEIYYHLGRGYYFVYEPELTKEEFNLVNTLLEDIYLNLPVMEQGAEKSTEVFKIKKFLYEYLMNIGNELEVQGLTSQNLNKIVYYLLREMSYSVLTPLIMDPYVEEIEGISYDKPVSVVHKGFTQYYRLETNLILKSEDRMRQLVERLADVAGKGVSVASPIQDFVLKEGHRVAVTYGSEVSLPGSTFDIRKHPDKPLNILDLIRNNMINIPAIVYLWVLAEAKKFILFVGPTGSGKTTVLNAMLTLLHPNAKILTIEDTPEIKIPHRFWVRLITRSTSFISGKEITLQDLIKLSLRYRPDYVIVGEVRGSEMINLVQAVASGHGGLTTFHGGSPEDVKARIIGLLPEAVAEEFKNLLSAIVIVKRLVNPTTTRQMRRITSIYEYDYTKDEFIQTFSYDFTQDKLYPNDFKTVNDIMQLYEKSIHLKDLENLLGWSPKEILAQMYQRSLLLKYLIAKNVRKYSDLALILNKFYTNRNEILNEIAKAGIA